MREEDHFDIKLGINFTYQFLRGQKKSLKKRKKFRFWGVGGRGGDLKDLNYFTLYSENPQWMFYVYAHVPAELGLLKTFPVMCSLVAAKRPPNHAEERIWEKSQVILNTRQ